MSTLRWTSPVRRDGQRELSSIPNEVYLEILVYLKPSDALCTGSGAFKQDLRSVAHVCRFFCSVALPWIFESFCLEIGGDKTDTRPENRLKFCRRLLNGEEAAKSVAHFVKKCEISLLSQSTPADTEWAAEELLSMYSKAISHMPNIEEIILSRITIKKDALKSLASLQQLKTLRIVKCQIGHDVKEKYLRKISALRLTSLDVLLPPYLDLGQPNHALVCFMERINLHCIARLLVTTMLPITHGDWELSKRLPLVELDLCYINMEPLFRFLAKTPSLRILRVVDVFDFHQTPFDPSTVPLLEELQAPLSVCKALVPGRPVTNLMVGGSNVSPTYVGTLGLTEAAIFQSASRPISQLRVAIQFYLEVPFWRYFPCLRVLHLDIITWSRDVNSQTTRVIKDSMQQIISNFTEAWPRYPVLHTLTFESGSFWMEKQFLNLEQQHSWIKNSLMPKLPALRTCGFSECIEWHYDETNTLWKPMVPNSRLREVRKLLQAVGGDYFVDFDNCFESVLSGDNH